MTTTAAADSDLVPAGALTGEPQWLALEPEPLYTVLHTPLAQTLTGHAALLLPAFGWDDECSYRRRRDWATQLASSGITAARFDFPGRENSAGSPLADHRTESWVEAAVKVARWLRERAGCDRLTAIGIGMGGLIAYQAVINDAPIDDLVLWGVRANGRAHVRELRAYAAVTATTDDADTTRGDGAIGIGGHVMSAENAATLSSISLTQLELPEADQRRVLLIGRDAHGVDSKLADHLAASGADLTVLNSDEYHALMSPPDLGLSPTKTVSASVDWIASAARGTSAPLPQQDGGALGPKAVPAVSFEHDGVLIHERLATLETAAGRLRGVITEPVNGSRAPYCLVSVNSGALRHTGPNRLFVEIARRAAASGVPSARFDLPGLGDSEGTAIRSFERTEFDDRTSLAAIEAIYDHLEALGVARRFVAAGFSLGGYLTVRAAAADSRVTAALCVNPTGFVWTDKQRKRILKDLIAMVGPDALMDEPAGDQLRQPLRRLAARLGRMRRAFDAELRLLLARSEILWRVEHRREIAGLNERLDALAGMGTQMLLLLSENEPLLRMLEYSTSAAKLARCSGITVEQLPNDDHLLRPLWIQEIVAERFVSALLEFSPSSQRTVTELQNERRG
ncbi:MAG TPA: alpha/beta fold hydrolase [Solirubrobacteraceae bacterium]|nr:alpha/beta fold hydrolase [Solirubrobacteraceae bacterium]